MPQCKLLPGYQCALVRLLLILVASSAVDISTPLPLREHHDAEIVDVTLLQEAWNSDHRSRRDVDSNLPDRLTFAIPVARDRAVINMKRSRLLPVIMNDGESTLAANSFSKDGLDGIYWGKNSQSRELDFTDNMVLEPWDAAVYTDLTTSSSMIVKRDSGNYMLRGTFVHQDVAWTLHYETRHQRDTDNVTSMPHLLSPYEAPERSFVGDTAEYSPELRTMRSAPGNHTPQMGEVGTESTPSEESPTQHVVEIAFVVDYADYIKWVKFVGLDNTPREIRLWYTFVAESMSIRYQNIKDPDIAIRTTVTVLRILNDANDMTLFTNRTRDDDVFDGDHGLKTFMEWCWNHQDLPSSDHYMLFTGLKLMANELGDLDGYAEIGALCSEHAVSIVRNDFSENTGHTAAHELGHSLSAEHDGDTYNQAGCTANNLYIMTTDSTTPVNPDKLGNNWKFSPCSIAFFKSFLTNVTCTREISTEERDLTAPLPGQRAGEVLSRDDQCRLAFQNRNSYFCEDEQEDSGGIEELCRGMQCFNPTSQECDYTMAQEYTPCGVSQWCRSGRCADKDESNTTTSRTISIAPTAATTVVRISSTSAAATKSRPPMSSRSSQANGVTTATSTPMTTLSTVATVNSRLSTPPSSATTIVSVTFALCLLFLSVL